LEMFDVSFNFELEASRISPLNDRGAFRGVSTAASYLRHTE
jgi:hypothetical protein